MTRMLARSIPALTAMMLGVTPAAAQTSEEILRELAALRAEVQQLRQEVASFKSAPPPVPEIVATQLSELAQTKASPRRSSR